MFIETFPSGPFSTNAYIVACPQTHVAAIVDPAPESAQHILNYLKSQQLNAQMILLTHSHWDHIADVHELKRILKIPVYIHALDAANLEQPGSDGLPCWIDIPSVHADQFLQEGDIVKVGELTFHVIHTPGHTPGGICFYDAQNGILLSGDTLFKGTIGNLSFPTSQPDLMWTSLAKLSNLPASTKVYPGHGPATLIGHESWLPYARDVFGNF